MTVQIINGKSLQHTIVSQALAEAGNFSRRPKCCMVSVDSGDPMLAVNRAVHVRTLNAYGLECEDICLPAQTNLSQLKEVIARANEDTEIDGVMVLMPLPAHLNLADVLPLISPDKELEGLHPDNSGAVLPHIQRKADSPNVLVAEALITQLKDIGFDLPRAHIVILSEAKLLAKNNLANLVQRAAGPAALPLTTMISLVVIEHPKAQEIARQADLLVVSLETPNTVGADFVKPGAVVIDFNPTLVDISEVDGQSRPILKGGVRSEEMGLASKYSPAPGGVGPVMLGILMRNLIRAAMRVREQ